jgi:N-acetylmuramoyl-L-alanine amidase
MKGASRVARGGRSRRAAFFVAILTAGLPALFPILAGQETTVEVFDLRSYTHPTYTRIVVDIGKLREFTSAELKDPDRVFIDVYQAQLNPIPHGKVIVTKCDYLREIRIAQKNETTVRLVVEINPAAVERYQVFPLFDPFRIVLDVFPKASQAAPRAAPDKPVQPPTPQPAQPTPDGYSMARQLGLGIRTVVIDAGHGGEDPGAIGRKGQKEKDVVLAVAKDLRDLLAGKGLNVILTRESDIFIPLENRTVVANQKAADIFVSIHANANRKKTRKGVQTFFLNFSPDPQVVEIAARENATSTRTIGQMKDTLGKIVRNSKILESRDLADKIQKYLVKSLSQHYSGVDDLGVRGGPFWVLIGGEMPSVLVEISHLSNSVEEERLGSPAYRKQVAQGIYDGIIEYMRSLGKG